MYIWIFKTNVYSIYGIQMLLLHYVFLCTYMSILKWKNSARLQTLETNAPVFGFRTRRAYFLFLLCLIRNSSRVTSPISRSNFIRK